MSKPSTIFIGMDVHEETTDVAFVSTEDSAVSFYGTILPTVVLLSTL
ncbi:MULTISPECIES: hypothetical protein [Morganellaceae]|uniref:Transposase n=1 Tax=Providencia rettgeri TaxID=587 RepID=A0AB35L406_PRORE|nr:MULTISPECIES: hypothetical protein [Morganellaceae]MDH2303808.1 hypothetical protein [Providencia rettgeri]MDL2140655.1 hypothetical protein [Proteus mirabilis]MDM3744648.1 hypothetical protein [Proteus mirabilis]NBM98894.1 hypothetical protein [Proteus sp. G4465]NBN06259.1 hypothetical protein [Proteus sp. G4463]